MKKLNLIIFISFFFLLLSGCVISFAKRWQLFLNTPASKCDTIPFVSIKLERRLNFIPTVPLMFITQSKKYGLEFQILTHKQQFISLDSIIYCIYDSTSNIKIRNKLYPNQVFNKKYFANIANAKDFKKIRKGSFTIGPRIYKFEVDSEIIGVSPTFFLTKDTMEVDLSYSTTFTTEYNININPSRKDVMKGDFEFYLTKINGQQRVFRFKDLELYYTGHSGIYSFI